MIPQCSRVSCGRDPGGPAGATMSNDATDGAYEPLYLAGIAHFNACEYYESHDIWEELWT